MNQTADESTGLRWVWIVAIAAATLLAYLPAIRGGWIWDDDHHVTANIQLHALHGLKEIWVRPQSEPQYYPLTHTTFWIEYHLWGTHPLGYHLDNVILHIANAVMVGLILCRLGAPGCFLAAALFALHPVQVESVAWVTERKNVLSGFLYLSALWIALDVWRIAPRAESEPERRRATWRYLLCCGLFILALLSKSVTASLPAVIAILIWWKRGRVTWRELLSLSPLFLCGAAAGSMTAWTERHVVGAVGPDWNFTPVQRILIAGRAIWFYVGKLIWPHPLIFIYHKWTVDPAIWWQWLFPVAAAGLIIWLWLRRKSLGRWALAAALFFVVSLVPALGFVNVYPMRYSFVADHFQYLASIAPIAVIAALLRRVPAPVVAALLLVLGVLTFRQGHIYTDSQTLWRDVVAKDDSSVIGHVDLGLIYNAKGDNVDATAEMQKALAADDHSVEAWLGLGAIAESQGRLDDAMSYYRKAAEAAPDNPLPPWNRGLLDQRLGNLAAAVAEFNDAAKTMPDPAPVYQQLGELEMSRGQFDRAVEQFTRALQFNPDLVSAHNDLAAVYLTEGQLEPAILHCRAALDINPDDLTANNNMGILLARQGDLQRAGQFFAKALRIDPTFAPARENLTKLRVAPE